RALQVEELHREVGLAGGDAVRMRLRRPVTRLAQPRQSLSLRRERVLVAARVDLHEPLGPADRDAIALVDAAAGDAAPALYGKRALQFWVHKGPHLTAKSTW